MPKSLPDIRISKAPKPAATSVSATKTKTRTSPAIAPDIFYDLDFCPVRSIFSPLGGKWSVLIISHLNFGTHRFSELLGAVPDISQRMLTQNLRSLERDGLIIREARATIPPRVDYTITPLGQGFLKKMEGVLQWSLLHRNEIEGNQHRHDKIKRDKASSA